MDLNDLQLPPALLTGLYPDTLVAENTDATSETAALPEKKPAAVAFPYLGGNEKQVLVLVDQPAATYLPDDELSFLLKILGACKLGLADVAVVNLHPHPSVTFKEISAVIPSRIALLFGIEPGRISLPIQFPAYQVQPFAGNSFLHGPALNELMKNEIEKTKLWVSLKRLFNL